MEMIFQIDLDAYSSNAEWVIMNTSADWSQFYYFSRPDERYPSIGFMVHLKRRYIFYIMNIILPSAMTSGIGCIYLHIFIT